MKNTVRLIIFISFIPVFDLILKALGVYGDLGATPIETIIHTTGDWGLRILIVTLLLTPLGYYSDITFFRQFPKPIGLVAFFYSLMHFLSYAIIDQSGDIKIIIVDIIETPYLIVGWGGFLCLLFMGIASHKRLQPWFNKNRSTISGIVYTSAVLAVWHYFWQAKTVEIEAVIYIVTVCILMLWRFKITTAKK
jgi:sulfoxide reductase heme-binding subunit YedZ